MLAIEESQTNVANQPIRPLDVTRDLGQVADLIEVCFASTMDPDGQEYLRQIRRMARDASLMRWATQFADRAVMPVSGLVWEENERVVGNLSLIPMWKNNRRIFLIANVAVHPDYRRRGIANALTEAALQHARDRGAWSTWLQVREENQPALTLYKNRGFLERARRSTWQTQTFVHPTASPAGVTVGQRHTADWTLQEKWLRQIYPPDITWNLPMHLNNFGPGFWNGLFRFLNADRIQHWSARLNKGLAGTITWQPARSYADLLWLAVPEGAPAQAILALLLHARRHTSPLRPLSVNFPAGLYPDTFQAAGFASNQTLIWMEIVFKTKIEVVSVERRIQ